MSLAKYYPYRARWERPLAWKRFVTRIHVESGICVDVKTRQLAVNAVLYDDQKGIEAMIKLASQKSDQDSTFSNHARHIQTTIEMVEQLEACKFEADDIFVEWSTHQSPLDFHHVKCLVKQSGYDSRTFLPDSSHALIDPVRAYLGQVLRINSWRLPLVFRILFTEDLLVDLNHSAAVDAIQNAQILRLLLADLSKNPKLPQLAEWLASKPGDADVARGQQHPLSYPRSLFSIRRY